MKITTISLLLAVLCSFSIGEKEPSLLKISTNQRYFQTSDGAPFFWMGDTGWLLFSKLKRHEAEHYLETRSQQGFNVIQVMLLHDVKLTNAYGDSALINGNVDMPLLTEGDAFADEEAYDYWDHVDYIINIAAQKGMYMAMVPVWGTHVRHGKLTAKQAETYAKWLALRYKNKSNIIWLNGGDTKGSDSTAIWNTIGNTLNKFDPNHLITFHPFGRTRSASWFHNQPWLHFNMFQSGHRRYDQDDSETAYGQDNWRYVADDYALRPVKPTLDGEPSYESIPQGLHDTTQPYWNADDVRRYAYWSVFAGGCGFTYGHNAVMQMHKTSDKNLSYGAREFWDEALLAEGAEQMKWLKKLMYSKPYFERIPAPELIIGEAGEKYDHIVATRGDSYAFIYTYTGREFKVNLKPLQWKKMVSKWYNPRKGGYIAATYKSDDGVAIFDAPGKTAEGNDWVLVLEEG